MPWYDCIFAAIMTGKTIIFTYGTTKNVYNCHNRQYLGYYVIRRIFQIFKKFLGRLIYFFNCFSLRSFSDTFPRNLYSILEKTPGNIIFMPFSSKVLSKSFCKDYEIGHKPMYNTNNNNNNSNNNNNNTNNNNNNNNNSNNNNNTNNNNNNNTNNNNSNNNNNTNNNNKNESINNNNNNNSNNNNNNSNNNNTNNNNNNNNNNNSNNNNNTNNNKYTIHSQFT